MNRKRKREWEGKDRERERQQVRERERKHGWCAHLHATTCLAIFTFATTFANLFRMNSINYKLNEKLMRLSIVFFVFPSFTIVLLLFFTLLPFISLSLSLSLFFLVFIQFAFNCSSANAGRSTLYETRHMCVLFTCSHFHWLATVKKDGGEV